MMNGRVRHGEGCIPIGSRYHSNHDAYVIDGDGNMHVFGGDRITNASVSEPRGLREGTNNDGIHGGGCVCGRKIKRPRPSLAEIA